MNFLARLKSGLSKSSTKLGGGISGIFTKRKLDAAALEALEELLIEADMGASLSAELVAQLARERFDKDISADEVKQFLAEKIAAILQPLALPLLPKDQKPAVVVMVGVNGNGKTTTIGKLAARFKADGKKVLLAAADTFRAAAVEQLMVWGERAQIPVVAGEPEADPASVAYKALEQAKAQGADLLLIDTAGRLQNKSNLMQQLQKTVNVLKKIDASAPHHVVLVLDATTGQNALSQVTTFKEMIGVSGLIITKLDGTARGGVVVALARQFKLPIHAIGVGEGIDDLSPFDPIEFAQSLLKDN